MVVVVEGGGGQKECKNLNLKCVRNKFFANQSHNIKQKQVFVSRGHEKKIFFCQPSIISHVKTY